MSSLVQISRKTGMAASTVAAVLRGAPGFRPETCERIRRAARELGYRPNYLSKALAGGRSMTIGVVVGSYDPALLWKVHAIETAARKDGYLTYVVFAGDRSEELSPAVVQNLLDRRVDGLMIYTLTPAPATVDRLVRKAGKPVVYIDQAPPRATMRIAIDQQRGMSQAAKHLRSLGHKSAAFLGIDFDLRNPSHKIEPYRAALRGEGMELTVHDDWSIDGEGDDVPQRLRQRVRRHAARGRVPTAIVCCDDELAIALIAGLRDEGVRVPEDVSVVGYDDHPLAAHATPPLTTLRQPRGEVGVAAFELLSKLIAQPGADLKVPRFEAELIVRESTGPAKSRA
jgi:DNA-binding LacI/PurR family transcriptional regulator